jgi:SulP family sulfate permease
VLGRIEGTTSWAPLNAPGQPSEVPGVLVLLFAAPLWYANATHFRASLDHARRESAQAPRLVVLDALGMYDVDFTGTQALSHALDELGRDGITFAVARAGDHLRQNLGRAGLLERIGAGHFYASVDEAVTAAG